MAAYGAKLAALNALNGDARATTRAAMPMVALTDPQVASVGLTEAAAWAAGHDVKASLSAPRRRAAGAGRARYPRSDQAGGGPGKRPAARRAILAPEGADSIQTAALAIKHGMTTRELGETIFPYLTTVEGLKLAAQSFAMDVAKLSCCGG